MIVLDPALFTALRFLAAPAGMFGYCNSCYLCRLRPLLPPGESSEGTGSSSCRVCNKNSFSDTNRPISADAWLNQIWVHALLRWAGGTPTYATSSYSSSCYWKKQLVRESQIRFNSDRTGLNLSAGTHVRGALYSLSGKKHRLT